MSNMIKLLSFAVVLFSAAAGGSWYLQNMQNAQKDAGEIEPAKAAHGAAAHGSTSHGASSHGGGHSAAPAATPGHSPKVAADAPRPLPRPATTVETDRITQMATALQSQQASLKKREEQLSTREKQMDIVHQEIVKEQKKLDAVRKEIQAELQVVAEKLEVAEKRLAEADKLRQKNEVHKEDIQNTMLQVSNTEAKNVKQLASIYDKMDAEAAASSIQQMVDQGKLDMAVGILANMRDRQAATVLGDLAKQDADIAVRLFDRMRLLKGPSLTPPQPRKDQ